MTKTVTEAAETSLVPYWTLADYERLIASGVFEDRRVELIGGQLFEMPPMEEPHIGATVYLMDTFVKALEPSRVRVQMPIVLPSDGEPEPDLAVVAPGTRPKARVEDVQLAVEVSHATRTFDRGLKLEAYLADGLHERWIIDLVERAALVYRGGILIGRYAEGAGAKLTAERVPEVTLELDQLFNASRQS
jgi:Uma2 family endonuclease